MKKVSMFTAVAILSAIPFLSYAQDPGTSAQVLEQISAPDGATKNPGSPTYKGPEKFPGKRSPEDFQNKIQERRNEFQTNFEDKKNNLEVKLGERKAEFTAKMEERRANIEAKLTERQARMETRLAERKQRVEERRTKLAENVKEKVQNLLVNVFERFGNMSVKLEEISNRLQTRITTLKEKGIDTGNGQTLLDTANDKIDTAIADIEAGKTTLKNAVEGEVSKEDVRDIVSSVKESIKSAHAALVDVVQEIRGIGPNVTDLENSELEDSNASSTTATTTIE